MYVLIAVILVFTTGQLVVSQIAGDVPPPILLAMMVSIHYIAGWCAWASHYSEWVNTMGWLAGLTLLIASFTINWTAYTLALGVGDTTGALPTLMALIGIGLPAGMYVASPFVDIFYRPTPKEIEE